MKSLYFDCFAGAAGDMILGALVNAGLDSDTLKAELSLLNLKRFEVDFERVDRSGISATKAHVKIGQDRGHRHLSEILKIINDSELNDSVKNRSAAVFSRLGEAEARIHNISVEEVHFHEVGAIDAIVDIVGASIGFNLLGIEQFAASALHLGSGTVEMSHGRFPVPPPAVMELLRNRPVYSTEIEGELVTPTGAAIISTVCESFGPMPGMTIEAVGYGAGTREYPGFPNVLRIVIGETEGVAIERSDEELLMIETNIDDMSPQLFGHIMERALERGALECYFTPVQMKKNRPGVLLSLLCHPWQKDSLYSLLFQESTTIGVRSYSVSRRALERTVVCVETEYGPIDVKIARLGGRVLNTMPEFEQCRAAAERAGVPVRDVERAALLSLDRDLRL